MFEKWAVVWFGHGADALPEPHGGVTATLI